MLGVIIGRFQPCHDGHLHLIRAALAQSERVAIVLGSHNSARTLRNPFRTHERREMISQCLTAAELARVEFLEVRDYFYKREFWINEVLEKVRQIAPASPVTLFGFAKDATSDYLTWFRDWKFTGITALAADATVIRDAYLRDARALETLPHLTEPVRGWLRNFSGTAEYARLYEERLAIDGYKETWKGAPYPPVFVTADALVVQAGHILLIRRAAPPGQGLLALPGGFLDQNETVEGCALRELQEETNFSVSADELRRALVDVKVFDHPLRSSRGRTITHAHFFQLPGDRLASFRSADDAASAQWLPILDLPKIEDEFFEDHFHIIHAFLRRY